MDTHYYYCVAEIMCVRTLRGRKQEKEKRKSSSWEKGTWPCSSSLPSTRMDSVMRVVSCTIHSLSERPFLSLFLSSTFSSFLSLSLFFSLDLTWFSFPACILILVHSQTTHDTTVKWNEAFLSLSLFLSPFYLSMCVLFVSFISSTSLVLQYSFYSSLHVHSRKGLCLKFAFTLLPSLPFC